MNRLYEFMKSKIHKRKYREVYRKRLIKSSKLLDKQFFKNPEEYSGNFITPSPLYALLLSCRKSGVWLKSNRFLGQRYIWSSKFTPYFAKLPLNDNSQIVVGNFIDGVSLVELKDVTCAPGRNTATNLNKFAMSISKFRQKPSNFIEEGFFAVAAGGDSFQHFLQDLAPILAFYKEFLSSNPQLPILLLRPLASFVSFDLLVKQIGIRNTLILIEPDQEIGFGRLCLPIFSPLNALYSTPVTMYSALKASIDEYSEEIEKAPNRTVLLVVRNEKTRNIENFSDLHWNVDLWSRSNGYNFDTVDPKIEHPSSVIAKFKKATFVIALHGGANYNIVFSSKTSTLIEFIPTENTNSLADFTLAIGINYLPIPVVGSISDFEFTVPIDYLLETLSKLNKVF